MRKTFISVAACVSLAACTPQEAATAVDQAQTVTEQLCGFVPTVQTILQFYQNASAITATEIAAAVCSVVTKKSGGRWSYNGIAIHGRFVR
jgi:hypothetical protein